MTSLTQKFNVHKNADGVWTRDGKPRESVTFIEDVKPSNIPGMSVITVLITLPPGGASPPHTHHGAAVFASTLSGTMRNQMNDGEPFISKAGDHFHESPGCRHVMSENMSDTEEAKFFATLILETEVIEKEGYGALLLEDAEVEERDRQAGREPGSSLPPIHKADKPDHMAKETQEEMANKQQQQQQQPPDGADKPVATIDNNEPLDSQVKPSFFRRLMKKFRSSS